MILKDDGLVTAWGLNSDGQVTVPQNLNGVVQISAGAFHSIALKNDGTVVAWGMNNYQQTSIPIGLDGIKAIAAGHFHNLALKNDGTVVAWGWNDHGQSSVPSNLSGVTAIKAGWAYSIALKSDGTVVTWGKKYDGLNELPMIDPPGLIEVTAIAGGHSHALALKNDGTIIAWGWNDDGQTNVPVGLSGVVSIAASDRGSYAVKNDGTVVAWGANWFGESTIPSGLSGVTSISANGYHVLAIAARPQFQIIQGSYTWHQAKADAEARGGRLAVLNTQAKIDEANAIITTSGYPEVWIGLTDEVQEGLFKWVNGDSLTMANWHPGQPDNSNDEDYVHYSGLLWNDHPTKILKSYLLEFPKQTLTVTPPTHGAITGAGEYEPGTSATLTATPDAGYIFAAWTGGASGTTNPLTLTMDSDKTVGATFATDLSDADADGLTAYDEVTLYHTDPTKADSDNDGLTDGYELGIGRFSAVSGTRTWAQAKAHAETQGGSLATFANQDEWNLAMQSIGTDALLDVGGLWIGATDEAVEGTWTWITGKPFVFTQWETGQPDNGSNSDYAAVAGDLGGNSGKWYDYRAATNRDGYILESGYSTSPIDADSDDDGLLDGDERTAGTNPFNADTDADDLTDAQEVNLTHTNPTFADSNSNGTNDALDDQDSDGLTNLNEITQHGTDPVNADTDHDGINDGAEVAYAGSFYKLLQGTFTYAQAVADATAKQGRVASFPTTTDYARVAAAARQTTQDYLWIGLSDTANEGTWVWTNGTTANYSRWLSGQPSGGAAENRVVIMQNSTQWADTTEDFQAAGYLFEHVGLDPLNPDTDEDGLTDGIEINTHHSSPVTEDTDGDGLSDSAEVNTHGSSPLLTDTDSDGLSDRMEVEVYHSNPALKDSDGDGFDDAFEVSTGLDPALATSTPDAVSSIRTSVEFRFNAANGVSYRIEASADLENWSTVETDIIGQSAVVTRFYSTENQPKRYFRVRRN